MVAAIIVAAGRGTRMKDPLKKQYLSLGGLPILTRTLSVFDACDLIDRIIIVIPAEDLEFCQTWVLAPLRSAKSMQFVSGGNLRQDSVYYGLREVDPDYQIVVIHDGVRPFVEQDQLVACIKGAEQVGACILGIPVHDTLKRVDLPDRIVETLQRDHVWRAQTPQAFRYALIKKAHEQARLEGFNGTDDALLVERLGVTVKVINGSRSNIKITNQEDLNIARRLIQN
jgi:2-C-methyl-D-erythritol 4-phosphate cytidylyltransferase